MAKVESMQLFWILLAVPLMPLAAMIQQHKFASQALAESENRFRQCLSRPRSAWRWSRWRENSRS